MTTRHFENAPLGIHPDSLLSSTLLMSGYAAPLRLTMTRTQQTERDNRGDSMQAPAEMDVNNIGRCIRWALAIEGGAVALICVGWALFRIWM
jgi:hypothetical protein